MSDAAQELPQPEQKPEAERRDSRREERLGTIEERLGADVGRIITTVGARVRRMSESISARVRGGQPAQGEPGAESPLAFGESLKVPEEFRGIIERYPLPAILVSCGAGSFVGSIVSGRRRR